AAREIDEDDAPTAKAPVAGLAVRPPESHRPFTATSLVRRAFVIGRSVRGRPLGAMELGARTGAPSVLVVGCIHGNEQAGIAVARDLETDRAPPNLHLWVVPV